MYWIRIWDPVAFFSGTELIWIWDPDINIADPQHRQKVNKFSRRNGHIRIRHKVQDPTGSGSTTLDHERSDQKVKTLYLAPIRQVDRILICNIAQFFLPLLVKKGPFFFQIHISLRPFRR